MPLERTAARICREAGARVAENVLLRDLNLDAPVLDDRRLEVVANALPIWGGVQVAVDTTLVSPVRADGAPRPGADREPGLALRQIRRRKRHHTYPELLRSWRCRLLVLGLEVGGRWLPGGVSFVRLLACAKSRRVPELLLGAAAQAYVRRWTALLAVAAQRALAASLLQLPLFGETCVDGAEPPVSDMLADARWESGPAPSRLPG